MSSVNDADVQIYLNELKTFTYSFGKTVNNGTTNLVELLNFILDDINEIVYSTQDKLIILNNRYALTSAMINSYNNLYVNTQIENRYDSYSTDVNDISAKSDYMYTVKRQLDTSLNNQVNSLVDINYENSQLLVAISNLTNTLSDAATVKDSIDTLITKCENT